MNNNKEMDREEYYSGNTQQFMNQQQQKGQQKFHQQKTKNNLCIPFIHNQCQSQQCPYLHDMKLVRVCINWKNRTCTKGNTCNFSHPPQAQGYNPAQMTQTQKCRFFYEQGECKQGENCSYRHGYEICPKYEMGFCPLGADCHYTHVQRKLCLNYMNGFCPQGPECNLAHPPTLTQKDLEFTIGYFNYLDKKDFQNEGKQIDRKTQYNIYRCFQCFQYGHKKKRDNELCVIDYDYNKLIFCRLCEKTHTIGQKCQQLKDQEEQDYQQYQQYQQQQQQMQQQQLQ